MPRKVIAHGIGSVHVPSYVTIKTGDHSADPEKVEISETKGNTTEELGLFSWNKMHGVKVTYYKTGKHVKGTIHDNKNVTFMATGAWSVTVEAPGE